MEDFVKEMGFESVKEFNTLVASADISTPEKMENFNKWKAEDGSKEGLLKLDGKRLNRIRMDKKELTIIVSGVPGTGKSRLTYLLKEFLKEKDIEVEFNGGSDFNGEANFDDCMSRNIDDVIKNFSDTRKIIIKEASLHRGPISS